MSGLKASFVDGYWSAPSDAGAATLWRCADAWLQRRMSAADVAAPVDGERLRRMIEGEVIPRLMLAHRADVSAATRGGDAVAEEDVAEFVRLALRHDVEVLREFATAVRERGQSLERLFLELFAPAARRLGALWDDDQVDFSTVSIALSRLHRLLLDLSVAEPFWEMGGVGARSVMVASYPGDQHDFGALMVGEVFRRDGWFVVDARPDTVEQLVDAVREATPEALCLSVSCERSVEELAAVVSAARDACGREPTDETASVRRLLVMVGGRALSEAPGLGEAAGADASCSDPHQAIEFAKRSLGAAASLSAAR